MRRKLRPDVKKFSVLLYTYKFVWKTKLKKFTIEPKSYTAMPLYIFLIVYYLLAKKNGNWKTAQGCRLSPILKQFRNLKEQFYNMCRKEMTQTDTAIVLTSSREIFTYKSFSAPHIILCHPAVIISGVRLPLGSDDN